MFPEKCFYVPGKTNIQDVAHLVSGAWVGYYSGEDEATMGQRVPGVKLYDFNQACEESDAAKILYYCKEPVEITEERYMDFLECLPPCKWTRHRGAEVFHISERLDGNIVQWCVKIGAKCWALNRPSTKTPAEIVDEVAAHAKISR